MSAAFEVLNIERMVTSSSALREGVLYELLGRLEHHDTRGATVRTFMRRYHVDTKQAKRVESLALVLLKQVERQLSMSFEQAKQTLVWAAKLHEIGISIAHSGYHKHSAYIVEYADMPGFSTMEQKTLGLLMRGQRRSLAKFTLPAMNDDRCLLILILRLAILFNRSRSEASKPSIQLSANLHGFNLAIDAEWLLQNPLTKAELMSEVSYWKDVNIALHLTV